MLCFYLQPIITQMLKQALKERSVTAKADLEQYILDLVVARVRAYEVSYATVKVYDSYTANKPPLKRGTRGFFIS